MKDIDRLHVLTDTELQQRYSHEELARLAIAGGAGVIQFRQKQGSTRQMIETARHMLAICRGHKAKLIINDRLDVALAAGADGVHLGQDDFPLDQAREILGPDKIIGGSASSVEEAALCRAGGVDYIGLGPVYPTTSKADAGPAGGLDLLRRVSREFGLPVIAIGGVNAARAAEVMGAGAHGMAVISAVCCQADPQEAAAELLRAMLGNR
ncbi:MAG: thiamine phosphate synthase [Desulfarculus sp.]|nr:thiamine phosphate synthase [Pseudomonadota bacterium]MBU4596959.1 thiamine phosphate synthase [Pseudomonadota bacterium]MBV1714290.1 thiamine phosphate synthase [Desulfarculus sp.]MBV1737654.1 thiamine phosphate synthase [Desulfarculus sp.]MBV1753399.1 thiamine phosphate synthase [Desulfarculus sp.]